MNINQVITTNDKVVKQYQTNDIRVVIEMPNFDKERDENAIKDINRIMKDELLLKFCS